jgi:FixJ family two-component response regulator
MGKTYMDSRRNVIAVVDNDQQLRGALGLLLSAFGYRTELFASAEEFLSAAATSEAACLVVETQLSGLSGIELGRRLASAGLKFPIIFLTRSWDAAIRQEAMNWGCIAYLHKSFLAGPLIEAIEMATAPNLSEPDK